MINYFHKTVSTVLGLGMAPFAPGTFGALGAVLFLYILNYYGGWSWPTAIIAISLILLIGTWSTSQVIKDWGNDPSRVVIDEFVGLLITVFTLPLTHVNIWLAFLLFRFFDILKPLGIRYLDTKIKGAWGVMLDDVLAGIYGFIVLYLLNHFIF